MKFSATFEEKIKKAEEQGDRPLVSSYLNPSKVDPKEPVSFKFLELEPLIFWGIFGESVHGEKGKSFRFLEEPTEKEILTEMGGSYTRGTKFQSTEPADAKETYVWPIYDYKNKMVRILEANQYQILKDIRKHSLNRKYPNLSEWDFSLSLDRDGGRWNYQVQIEPQAEEDQSEVEAAWEKTKSKGFDLTKLLSYEDPFGG
jgi:hypothetical protein